MNITTGMTNLVYVHNNNITRLFGSECAPLIDRKLEEEIMNIAARNNIGPRIVEHVDNGRLEEHLFPSRVLSIKDLMNPRIVQKLVTRLQQFHRLKIPNRPLQSCLEERVNIWSSRSGLNIPQRIQQMIEQLSTAKGQIVLAHNDLTLTNMLLYNDTIYFIDMEYSDYNYLEFEIGNFMCEIELTSPNITIDFQQICILYTGATNTGIELYDRACKIKPLVHFLWSCWAKVKGDDEYYNLRAALY